MGDRLFRDTSGATRGVGARGKVKKETFCDPLKFSFHHSQILVTSSTTNRRYFSPFSTTELILRPLFYLRRGRLPSSVLSLRHCVTPAATHGAQSRYTSNLTCSYMYLGSGGLVNLRDANSVCQHQRTRCFPLLYGRFHCIYIYIYIYIHIYTYIFFIHSAISIAPLQVLYY